MYAQLREGIVCGVRCDCRPIRSDAFREQLGVAVRQRYRGHPVGVGRFPCQLQTQSLFPRPVRGNLDRTGEAAKRAGHQHIGDEAVEVAAAIRRCDILAVPDVDRPVLTFYDPLMLSGRILEVLQAVESRLALRHGLVALAGMQHQRAVGGVQAVGVQGLNLLLLPLAILRHQP